MLRSALKILAIVIAILLILVITIFIVDAAKDGSFKILFGIEEPSTYVSDDFKTLCVEGQVYERIDVPFDMISPRAYNSDYTIQFANFEYKHSKVYVESVSKRYPFVWMNDVNYHLYINYLANDFVVMQISNEYTNEIYSYCLSEQRSSIENIINSVSWESNRLFAEYTDQNGNPIKRDKKEELPSELVEYIISAKATLVSNVPSTKDIKFNDDSSAAWISIYQYDSSMTFCKKLFDIRMLKNGDYYLYDDNYMYFLSKEPNATIEDYSYLLIPQSFNDQLKQYQEKAKDYQQK